jgi:hypothetical protein
VQAARGVAAEDGDQLRAQPTPAATSLVFPPRTNAGMTPRNASSWIEMIVRTGCITRPVEKRCSADAIVSMRSSIDRTAFTSGSVRRRKRPAMQAPQSGNRVIESSGHREIDCRIAQSITRPIDYQISRLSNYQMLQRP